MSNAPPNAPTAAEVECADCGHTREYHRLSVWDACSQVSCGCPRFRAPTAAEVGGHQSAVEEIMGGGKGHVAPTAAERAGDERIGDVIDFVGADGTCHFRGTVYAILAGRFCVAVLGYPGMFYVSDGRVQGYLCPNDGVIARLANAEAALLAARRERETAYETTAQVRDALSEEILKLRDHLAAVRRENEASAALRERVRLEAASLDDYANELAEGTLTGRVLVGASRRLMDAYTAALAAAHGEDR